MFRELWHIDLIPRTHAHLAVQFSPQTMQRYELDTLAFCIATQKLGKAETS